MDVLTGWLRYVQLVYSQTISTYNNSIVACLSVRCATCSHYYGI